MRSFSLCRMATVALGTLLLALSPTLADDKSMSDLKEQAKAAIEIAKARNLAISGKSAAFTDIDDARKAALTGKKPMLVFVNVPVEKIEGAVAVSVKEYVGDKMANQNYMPSDKRIVLMVPDKNGKRLYFRTTLKSDVKQSEIKVKVLDAKKAIDSSKLDIPLERVYVTAAGWHTHKCSNCGDEISHYSPNHVGSDAEHACPFCGQVNKVVDREGVRIEYRAPLANSTTAGNQAAPASEEDVEEQIPYLEEEQIGFFPSGPCPNGRCPQQSQSFSYRVVPEYQGTVTPPLLGPATTVKKTTTTTVVKAAPTAVVVSAPVMVRQGFFRGDGFHPFARLMQRLQNRSTVRGMFW